MRLFQNSGIYPSYLPRLAHLRRGCNDFKLATATFLSDRYCAVHFLQPVLCGDPDAFFTNGDDSFAQRLWAVENGLNEATPLDKILLAQIEHHRTEVFYNLDPMRFGDAFLSQLPGSVRRTVAWRAAPSAGGSFLTYDVIVNNFPGLLEGYAAKGVRAEYLFPAHDPEMELYAQRTERPVDVIFVGGYSRHHMRRARLLEAIAALRSEMHVVMHLDRSRLTRLAETPLGTIGPLAKYRRPRNLQIVAQPPVFGRQLFEALSSAKVVVNCAIDMAAGDRGNMRVWEALGCATAMVSDAGRYPDDFVAGRDFLSYSSIDEAVAQVRRLISNRDQCKAIAGAGHKTISKGYSKERQWQRFQAIVA
jgi:hypothetical protein